MDFINETMTESYTTVQIFPTKHKWTIHSFGLYLERSEQSKDTIILNSSSFMVANTNNHSWRLQLIFFGNTHEQKDFVRIRAISETPNISDTIFASVDFNFFADGAKFKDSRIPIQDIAKIHRLEVQFKKNSWMKTNIFLPNVAFAIICRINVMGDTTTVTKNSHVPIVTHNNLSNDLAGLLTDEKFADFSFILCNRKKLKVHKAILAARCQVFANMFEELGAEQKNIDEVSVNDVDSDLFKKMLEYIYKNQVNDLDNYAMNLLSLADKYELKDLLEMCEKALCLNMSVENAAEILVLADRHNAKELIKFSLNFMRSNMAMVVETEGYNIMESEYPDIALKLHQQLLLTSPYD